MKWSAKDVKDNDDLSHYGWICREIEVSNLIAMLEEEHDNCLNMIQEFEEKRKEKNEKSK